MKYFSNVVSATPRGLLAKVQTYWCSMADFAQKYPAAVLKTHCNRKIFSLALLIRH